MSETDSRRRGPVLALALGGLLLGAGFIISGYCPGTSMVSAASGNVDGFVTFSGVIVEADVNVDCSHRRWKVGQPGARADEHSAAAATAIHRQHFGDQTKTETTVNGKRTVADEVGVHRDQVEPRVLDLQLVQPLPEKHREIEFLS